jgi:CheY-like chemotaxis protein
MSRKIGVLIVEDYEDTRNTIKDVLSKLGCCFFEAEGGQEALALLRQQAMDVIVLDIGLPGMNGLDLLRKAKRDGMTLPPVIVITGEPAPYEKDASELGVREYFEKDDLPVKRLREAVFEAATRGAGNE